MDDFYNIHVNPDHKLGLALLDPDLSNFQFLTTLGELDNEQLLALDDTQNFHLAFPHADVTGTCEEAASRASTAVTPISECSSRTTFSVRNVSPVSDIMSFQDTANPQDFEVMIQDATPSIMSSRAPQGNATSWAQLGNDSASLNGTLTPSRQFSRRPQSFSYRTPQFVQHDGSTPPPPSSYFTSPNLSSAQSPFLSPNLQSPLMLPQAAYSSVSGLRSDVPQYYGQVQSQLPPTLFQQIHQPSPYEISLQQPLQAQSQILKGKISNPNINSNSSMMHSFYPQQDPHPHQHQHQHQQQQLPSQSQFPTSSLNASSQNTGLPHTTGNSATGYQCFSHGCGGRHFSNWGNLVRHHRERQLRSKAGAKPTCPRCGKGFTRSSARDAHVAGLKCVLGRRRRGAAAAAASSVQVEAKSTRTEGKVQKEDGQQEEHQDSSGELDAEAEDDEEDEAEIRTKSFDVNTDTDEGVASPGHLGVIDGDLNTGSSYLAPQHLDFEG